MPMQAKAPTYAVIAVACIFLTCLIAPAFGQAIDQTLLGLTITKAVQTHPSVQAAREARLGSDAGYEAARWQYYPSPSISIERGSNETQRSTGSTSNTTLRLQQNLWTGGRIAANVNAARKRVDLAQIAVMDAQMAIATRALDAWLSLLTSFGRKQATQASLERMQRLTDMMGRRLERDVSPGIDAVLMRSRLTQIQSDLLAYTASHDSAAQRLAQLVGEPDFMRRLNNDQLVKILQESDPLLPASTLTDILANLDKQLGLRRNEVEIAIAQEELLEKKSQLYPNVYLRLDRQFNNSGESSLGGKSAETKLSVGLEYSPGAGLSLSSYLQLAQSRIATLQQDRESVRRELQDRIGTDWRDYSVNTERLKYAVNTVQSAQDVLDSYTRLFVVGRRGWLEVLNAARELSLAEQLVSDLQAQQAVGSYRLRMHQGVLAWQYGA